MNGGIDMLTKRHDDAIKWLKSLPVGKPYKLTNDQKMIILDVWFYSIEIPFTPLPDEDWYIDCSLNLETLTKLKLI